MKAWLAVACSFEVQPVYIQMYPCEYLGLVYLYMAYVSSGISLI